MQERKFGGDCRTGSSYECETASPFGLCLLSSCCHDSWLVLITCLRLYIRYHKWALHLSGGGQSYFTY